jgi:hypothetical protein
MAGLNRIPWWEWWIPFRPWRVAAVFDAADEIPTRLPSRAAVIVGSLDRPKWIAFDCPCGTGHRIMVSLDSAHRPHWRLDSFGKLTLWPSVDYHTGRMRCHYFIRQGRVDWVRDSYGGHRG